MSLFGYGSSVTSLKALLENPDLQKAPSFNQGEHAICYFSAGSAAVQIFRKLTFGVRNTETAIHPLPTNSGET